MHSCFYAISPEFDWEFGLKKKCPSYFKKVPAFFFHHTILLWCGSSGFLVYTFSFIQVQHLSLTKLLCLSVLTTLTKVSNCVSIQVKKCCKKLTDSFFFLTSGPMYFYYSLLQWLENLYNFLWQVCDKVLKHQCATIQIFSWFLFHYIQKKIYIIWLAEKYCKCYFY